MLTESGRIVPSWSPYGHPVLFSDKKGGGGLRLCINYRALNSNTVNDAWPLPRIDELLSRLRGSRIFSKLDLSDGYNQIPIDPPHRYKTAFVCRYGAFKYNVMPFGLNNAPSHFQRAMNLMLGDLVDVCVLVYLDDIHIFSHDEREHEEHARLVFERLAQKQFHIKRQKYELFLPKVEFLGHQVSVDGVQVVQSKVDAIVKWPTPTCVRDIQSFLGLCNYYRRLLSPLQRLQCL